MMHHAQIAQRAFNTPLMVDPAKALAFLSGLGSRITGQEITFQGLEVDGFDQAAATLPARASLFGNDLAQRHQRNGTLTADVATDETGQATLAFVPRLRSSPVDGSPLEIAAPAVVLRLTAPVPTRIGRADSFLFTLAAREAL